MSQYTEGNVKAFQSAEALAAFTRVKLDSAGDVLYADARDDCIGSTEKAVADDTLCPVRLKSASGTRKLTASGAISIGDKVYGDADGKITATPKGIGFGIALEAATADGDIIEVSTATEGEVFKSEVTLTAAQIKLLATTEIELVAAPGADKFLQFLGAILILNYGSEVLAEDADNLDIEYDDGTGAAVCTTIECTGFIDQAADQLAVVIPIVIASVTAAANVNKNLALVNNNDNFTGNATGDTTITVITTYLIHDCGLA